MKDAVEVAKGGFKLESNPNYLNFKKVEVTEVDESKPWKPPVKVKITKADGSVEEGVDANTPFFIFKDENLRELTVSAAEAGHIHETHFAGDDPGSKFDYPSLEALLLDAEEKLPDSIFVNPEAPSAFDIEMGKPMGREGLATLNELLGEGLVSASDIKILQDAKNEVFAANASGTPESRAEVAKRFNEAHPECKIRLQVIRGGAVLVPTVNTPKRPTTKLFMVFGPNGKGGKTLWTAAPGRNMPRHPVPTQFNEKEGGTTGPAYQESAKAWFETAMLTGK